MFKELVKWRPNEPGSKMDAALTKLGQPRQMDHFAEVSKMVVSQHIAGEVVDLPRVCAVHDKPYIARYIEEAAGRFVHSQTIRVTEDLWQGQYENNPNVRAVPTEQLGDEYCPWCGAHSIEWHGPVSCPKCMSKVCFGRTAKNYFRCRRSCGREGYLKSTSATERGLIPTCRNGPGGSAG